MQGETEDPEGAFRDRWGGYYGITIENLGKNLFFSSLVTRVAMIAATAAYGAGKVWEFDVRGRKRTTELSFGANLHPLVYDLLCFQWFELPNYMVGLSLKGSYTLE